MSIRRLPSIDSLADSIEALPRPLTIEIARQAVEEARKEESDPHDLARRRAAAVQAMRPRRLINATGVLLHTNLGRAPLAEGAARAMEGAAGTYGNLEFDLHEGTRGGRGAYAQTLLAALTGTEAALVVNNNAGALFLALAALAHGREVPVSRGELIEIGGSFRLPELMAASGATLVEVGTTNRTRPADYEQAVSERTAALLKVHPSNYRIEGFSASVSAARLVAVAAAHELPLLVDAGSGLLDARAPWLEGPPPSWLAEEPGVRQLIRDGAGLVLFSGDKLLGGPQAGLVVGSQELISPLASHPVARALRCDGPRLAALAATLDLYASGRGSEIPFWRMATIPYQELEIRLKDVLAQAALDGDIRPGASLAGAGSVPGTSVPSPVLMVPAGDAADRWWAGLLRADPPLVARRQEDALLVDLRAVDPKDDEHVARTMRAVCRS